MCCKHSILSDVWLCLRCSSYVAAEVKLSDEMCGLNLRQCCSLISFCRRGAQEGHSHCAAQPRWYLESQVRRRDSCQRVWPALFGFEVHRYCSCLLVQACCVASQIVLYVSALTGCVCLHRFFCWCLRQSWYLCTLRLCLPHGGFAVAAFTLCIYARMSCIHLFAYFGILV